MILVIYLSPAGLSWYALGGLAPDTAPADALFAALGRGG